MKAMGPEHKVGKGSRGGRNDLARRRGERHRKKARFLQEVITYREVAAVHTLAQGP